MVTDIPKCSQGLVDPPQHAGDRLGVLLHRLFPFFEIDGAGKRGKRDKLSKRQLGTLRQVSSGRERVRRIAGQAENE